jgi:hypothetical protein
MTLLQKEQHLVFPPHQSLIDSRHWRPKSIRLMTTIGAIIPLLREWCYSKFCFLVVRIEDTVRLQHVRSLSTSASKVGGIVFNVVVDRSHSLVPSSLTSRRPLQASTLKKISSRYSLQDRWYPKAFLCFDVVKLKYVVKTLRLVQYCRKCGWKVGGVMWKELVLRYSGHSDLHVFIGHQGRQERRSLAMTTI